MPIEIVPAHEPNPAILHQFKADLPADRINAKKDFLIDQYHMDPNDARDQATREDTVNQQLKDRLNLGRQ